MPFRMVNWDSIAEKWTRQWHQLRPWQVLERLSFASQVRDSLVLDLGCGPGRDVEFFNEIGLECVGIDFSLGMLKQTEKRGRLIRASAEYTPFRPGCFDAVWSCSLMRYLSAKEVEQTMREAARVLRPGGLLWLSLEYGAVNRTEVKHGVSFTAQLFTMERLKHLADRTGFRILETQTRREWRPFLIALLKKRIDDDPCDRGAR